MPRFIDIDSTLSSAASADACASIGVQRVANVVGYGATGNGTTDDTTAIHAARNAAGVGGKLFFPVGTYLVDELTASVADQTWTLDAGATLKMAVGSSAVVTITGDGVTVEGGTLDASNGTLHDWSQNGVVITGDDATLRNVTILNSPKHGVRGLNCGGTTVTGCTITDSYNNGVFIQNLTGEPDRYHFRITDNTVVTSSIYGAGLSVMSVDVHTLHDVHIVNNTVRVPRDSGEIQALAAAWNCTDAIIDSNILDGGWGGISYPEALRHIISNNVISGFWKYGIEVATNPKNVVIAGNTIDMDGVSKATDGIVGSVGSAENIVITGNTLSGFNVGTSKAISLSYAINGLVISGNAISNVSGRLDAIYLFGDKDGVSITNNVIDANSVDPSIGIQTISGAITGLTITGNTFRNIVTGCVNLSSTGSATYTDVTVVGNTFSNCGPTIYGGGATAGTSIVTDSTPATGFTATAAGTTVLTADSAQVQVFTGTTTQNCNLPYTNIKKGQRFTVVNTSTGTVTVKEGVGGLTIKALTAGSWGTFMALQSIPTAVAHWSYGVMAP
jgi:hypothetical protein